MTGQLFSDIPTVTKHTNSVASVFSYANLGLDNEKQLSVIQFIEPACFCCKRSL